MTDPIQPISDEDRTWLSSEMRSLRLAMRPSDRVSDSYLSRVSARVLALDARLTAAEAALAKLRSTYRWNINRTADGLLVCDGGHAKSSGCEFVEYAPKERLTAAEAERDEAKRFAMSIVESANARADRAEAERDAAYHALIVVRRELTGSIHTTSDIREDAKKVLADLAAAIAQRDRLREAMEELVACKDMKAVVGDAGADHLLREQNRVEYERRKPLAWAEARTVLAAIEKETP